MIPHINPRITAMWTSAAHTVLTLAPQMHPDLVNSLAQGLAWFRPDRNAAPRPNARTPTGLSHHRRRRPPARRRKAAAASHRKTPRHP